ncbi:MAG TPA: glycosyltransferase family 1 protein [Ramlibacter sp.]|nr:glycosyltransferase family 1 protein [Ramlibacter sp.]
MAARDVFVVADQWGPQSSGMGVYAYEVARRLPALLRPDGLTVTVAVRADAPSLADEVREGGGEVVTLLPNSASNKRKLPEVYFWLPMRSRGWNCYYSLDHKLPAGALLPRFRVATVCDICPLEFPDEYGTLKRLYFGVQLPKVLRTANRIATISDHTANKLVTVLNADRRRIDVSPCGMDLDRYSTQGADNEAEQLFTAYGLTPKSYHLFVGRISPRKNFSLVIEAARRLKERGGSPLVVVAGPKGWRDEGDWRRIREYGLEDHFRVISFVPGALLPALYRQARGLLYPSFSEGFGIPVLESLACGTPVVVATGTSCVEIGGPLVDAIDPHDAQALAQWMQGDHVVDETARRAWLAQFSWDKTAELIASTLAPRLAALRTHPEARTPSPHHHRTHP